jgi:hypothetical protein
MPETRAVKVRQERQEAALTRDGSKATLSRSNAMAFVALSESPSLTRYVLGV